MSDVTVQNNTDIMVSKNYSVPKGGRTVTFQMRVIHISVTCNHQSAHVFNSDKETVFPSVYLSVDLLVMLSRLLKKLLINFREICGRVRLGTTID